MNGKVVKIIGFAASVVGALASVASSWACEKQADEKIAKKIEEALAKAGKES